MKIRIYACLLCIAFLLIPVSNLIGQERTNRPRKREHPPIPKVGTFAKDFSLKTADGETFKLSEHKGRIIILEFGACT